jgi:hypothetical protein
MTSRIFHTSARDPTVVNTTFSIARNRAGIADLRGEYSALRFANLSGSTGVPSWRNRLATGGVDMVIEEGDYPWLRRGWAKPQRPDVRSTGSIGILAC